MTLARYRKKRNFKHTPEPFGKKGKSRPAKLVYVIQKHAASHLHYDLRLEMNGVLKSWAVPKGPSLDPAVKRLAVHVEDHPLEYGSFEGIIPAGQYGGGTVMLWDEGAWEYQDENYYEDYQKGSLTFVLKGKKLKGLWKLIQIKNDPKNWLLLKINDRYAASAGKDITIVKPKSVISHRTIEQIAGHLPKKTAKQLSSNSKKIKKISPPKSAIPASIHPQLATLVNQPPAGDQWLHEIKFDGYRLLCVINKKKIKWMTRNQKDWTKKFSALTKAIRELTIATAILDGEVVAINEHEQFDFQLLQNSINEHNTTQLVYYVFDIIYHDGVDLTTKPLLERKHLLQQLITNKNMTLVRYSEHIIGNGKVVFEKACQIGLEGIISKRTNSPYVQKRTRFWLKSKCLKRQEFVVGGFTKPRGERQHFGSLLLGVYATDKNKLSYCGHVGTGFSEATLKMLAQVLSKHKTTHMPFAKRPPDINNVTWIKPEIIVEVEFSGWTQDKVLRHPSFKGIRSDKPPKEIVVEKPQVIKKVLSTNNYPVTNPEKILYPESGITKLAIAKFYEAIHEWILPHIINRPLSLVRCPHGLQQKCFYQKHLTEAKVHDVYTIDVKEKNKKSPYLYIKDKNGLMALVQLGVLEIHPWGVHIDHVDTPDVIVFDLDPAPDVAWKRVIQAARLIRNELLKLDLISFVKTTGGKGLHITIPIRPQYRWDQIKIFAQAFAKYIVSLKPDSYIDISTKAKRAGKIYIDYLRNQRGATAIAPYSTRAYPGATIATPLRWEELTTKVKSDTYTIQNLLKRLKKLKTDPWEGFFEIKQTLKFM